MEYIALFARYDTQFSQIVDQLVTGKIKNIKVEDTSNLTGGALSKSVPRPKAHDNREYMSGLNAE